MIKTITANSTELDDAAACIDELLMQLSPENNFLKYSIGILCCNFEYVEPDILTLLTDRLNIDIVGLTTILTTTDSENYEKLSISFTVLTSNDVVIKSGISDSLETESKKAIVSLYDSLKSSFATDISIMMTFSSPMNDMGGDELVSILDDASGGVLNFGSLAVFDTATRLPELFYNGKRYTDRVVLILFSGVVNVVLKTYPLAATAHIWQSAIITASEGNILKEVNNIPAMKYIHSIGLAQDEKLTELFAIPLLVHKEGYIPLACTIINVLDESRIVCGRSVPQGATLSISPIDYDFVMDTMKNITIDVVEKEPKGVLIFSCFVRSLMLGVNSDSEFKVARNFLLKTDTSFMIAYSGGEICPVETGDGTLKNSFHNVAVVCCAFL
jgi:hypothetical protein